MRHCMWLCVTLSDVMDMDASMHVAHMNNIFIRSADTSNAFVTYLWKNNYFNKYFQDYFKNLTENLIIL